MNTTTINRLEKYSWRIGVFITLSVTAMLAIVAANEVLQDLEPVAADFLAGALNLGMTMMAASFIIAFAVWAYKTIPNYWQHATAG